MISKKIYKKYMELVLKFYLIVFDNLRSMIKFFDDLSLENRYFNFDRDNKSKLWKYL